MSAEQQKILWIIASIAFIVVALLGVGMWWFYPGAGESAPAVAAAAPAPATAEGDESEFDFIEWVRNNESYPGLAQPQEEKKSDDVIVIRPEKPAGEEPSPSSAAGQSVPQPGSTEKSAQQQTASESSQSSRSAPSAQSSQSAAERPAAGQSAAKQPAAGAQQKRTEKPAAVARAVTPRQKPAPKPAPAKPAFVNEYWIQVASFTSISHAEDVRDRLQEKGITAVITSKTVKEDTYYRVRIGPYANKNEAEKFLSWIQKLDDYAGSYISLVPRKT